MLLLSFPGLSQIVVVNGMVSDSATFKSLSGVSLQIINQSRGTTTNDKGYFSLSLKKSDSVTFSRVGYESKTVSVEKLLASPVVYLREVKTILREITISPSIEIQGIPKIPKESMWVNPTYTKSYTDIPGAPSIQTFGPSIVKKGIFSQFNKYEKEKKRLPKLREENKLVKSFITTVSDSVFVDEFTKLYQISKSDYWEFLQQFNQNYGNAIYELPQDELISLLHITFSQSRKNGRTK